MSAPPRSWREVAHLLANRLQCHAFCEQHPIERADPKNCPFCEDRLAYLAFLRFDADEQQDRMNRAAGKVRS